jgi:hypothetical protein
MSQAELNKEGRLGVVAAVLEMTDYSKELFGGARLPTQGQMVVTGLHNLSIEKRLGFCVQIRRGCGQFGSDMVFLRHPDGSLTTHENQAYFPMSEKQETLARTLFSDLPEEEDYTHGYSCCAKVHEVGFLIENSKSQPTPNTPFSLTVKSSNGDRTLIQHIG